MKSKKNSRLSKKLKTQNKKLNSAINEFIVRNYGSRDNFNRYWAEIQKKNLEKGIIDWPQLTDFFFDNIPDFENYYKNYLLHNEPPLCEYPFFSYILKPFLYKIYEDNQHPNLYFIYERIEYLMKNCDDSVLNEIGIVFCEEMNLDIHFDFMSEWMQNHLGQYL